MRNVSLDEIKVGDLLVPNADVFMLGDRWVVEAVTDTHIEIQIYHCGVSLFRDNGWYHMKISKDNKEWEFLTRDETLEGWINYYTSDEKRNTYYEATLKYMTERNAST
jgi:hypothetical protein